MKAVTMRCVSVDAPKLRCRFARGPDDLVVALLLHDLAGLYESIGRYSDAYRRSLAINEREHGPHRGGKTFDLRARELGRVGKYADAVLLVQRALAIKEKVGATIHPTRSTLPSFNR
jgi:hypothetical protein